MQLLLFPFLLNLLSLDATGYGNTIILHDPLKVQSAWLSYAGQSVHSGILAMSLRLTRSWIVILHGHILPESLDPPLNSRTDSSRPSHTKLFPLLEPHIMSLTLV